MATDEANTGVKRELDNAGEAESSNKKVKSEQEDSADALGDGGDKDKDGAPFVQPGTVGVTTINDNDVLSG